jgi:hypothetical protein
MRSDLIRNSNLEELIENANSRGVVPKSRRNRHRPGGRGCSSRRGCPRSHLHLALGQMRDGTGKREWERRPWVTNPLCDGCGVCFRLHELLSPQICRWLSPHTPTAFAPLLPPNQETTPGVVNFNYYPEAPTTSPDRTGSRFRAQNQALDIRPNLDVLHSNKFMRPRLTELVAGKLKIGRDHHELGGGGRARDAALWALRPHGVGRGP